MADKPSRALVLYGDGLARFITPTQTHLHSLASRASSGFLALPHSPPSENEDTRIIREFAELLDANEAYGNSVRKTCEDKSQEKFALPTLAERFMGMKAAIFTNNLALKSFAGTLGFNVFHRNEFLASELLKLLGFQEGKASDDNEFDLVFVHFGAGEKMNDLEEIELVNHFVGDLLNETDVGYRLHVSVIMSYGATQGDVDLELSVSGTESKKNGELSLIFPHQSYMMKGGKLRENVRQHCPMLLAQYQNAVTRVDAVESFSFGDFIENSGNLVIPADRFIHEVAFKLWKAPKYGA